MALGSEWGKKNLYYLQFFLIIIRNEVTDSIYKTKQQIESGLSIFFES